MWPLNWSSHWSWWPLMFLESKLPESLMTRREPCLLKRHTSVVGANVWWVHDFQSTKADGCSFWPSILLEDPEPERHSSDLSICIPGKQFGTKSSIFSRWPIGMSRFGSDCITLLRFQRCGAACLEAFSDKIWTAGLWKCGLITNGWLRFS